MRAHVAIVPGEEELGPQRQCIDCGEWWPNDPEFYYVKTYRLRRTGESRAFYVSPCRACWNERAVTRYATQILARRNRHARTRWWAKRQAVAA